MFAGIMDAVFRLPNRRKELNKLQKALRNRIRIHRTVIMDQESSLAALTKTLTEFGLEKDKLNSDNPPIPRSAFFKAVKDLTVTRAQRTLSTPVQVTR